MILLYLFFGLLIAYAIRLYMKRNKPFKPIKPEDLKKDIYYNDDDSLFSTQSMFYDSPLHPLNWQDEETLGINKDD